MLIVDIGISPLITAQYGILPLPWLFQLKVIIVQWEPSLTILFIYLSLFDNLYPLLASPYLSTKWIKKLYTSPGIRVSFFLRSLKS